MHTLLLIEGSTAQRSLHGLMKDVLGCAVIRCSENEKNIAGLLGTIQPAPDLVFLDASSVEKALALVKVIRGLSLELPLVLVADAAAAEQARTALLAGISTYIVRPVTSEKLRQAVPPFIKMRELRDEVFRLRREMTNPLGLPGIRSASAAMRNICLLAEQAAATGQTVLIEGETGVGKTYLARAIHAHSKRTRRPFIVQDCRQAAPDDISSPVGASSQADDNSIWEDKHDSWQEANGGTLVLCHVDALAASDQAALKAKLSAVRQQGDSETSPRLIVTSRHSLKQLVNDGRFDKALYAEIQTVRLQVPPLRDRKEDIEIIAGHLLKAHALAEGKPARILSPEALLYIRQCSWPGNIHELDRTLWRGVLLAEGSIVELAHLINTEIRKAMTENGKMPKATVRNEFALHTGGWNKDSAQATGESGAASKYTVSLINGEGNAKRLDQLESEAIQFALAYYDGHMSEIAKRLGIGRSTLYRKLQELGLSTPHQKQPVQPVSALQNIG